MRGKKFCLKGLFKNQSGSHAKFIMIFFIGVILVMGACKSSPAIELKERVKPDNQNAVVYFIGYRSDEASIWDGVTPIGDYSEGPRIANIPWKTKPGDHYFMANTFNWVVLRANLKANKTYYVRLEYVPNPIPFAKGFVVLRILEQEEGEWWLNRSKSIAFPDTWRTEYAKGDIAQEAKDQLQKARNDKTLKIDLK